MARFLIERLFGRVVREEHVELLNIRGEDGIIILDMRKAIEKLRPDASQVHGNGPAVADEIIRKAGDVQIGTTPQRHHDKFDDFNRKNRDLGGHLSGKVRKEGRKEGSASTEVSGDTSGAGVSCGSKGAKGTLMRMSLTMKDGNIDIDLKLEPSQRRYHVYALRRAAEKRREMRIMVETLEKSPVGVTMENTYPEPPTLPPKRETGALAGLDGTEAGPFIVDLEDALRVSNFAPGKYTKDAKGTGMRMSSTTRMATLILTWS
ncbi:hypothetical protein F5146DRAFT_1121746 [Armillaria mellea]|nr:hypothetical protein F5146DRAFT_1121746 [Armillaria mellea]